MDRLADRGNKMRRWPHKNGAEEIAQRRRQLGRAEALDVWLRLPEDAVLARFLECYVGRMVLPVAVVPIPVQLAEYDLDAEGRPVERHRALETVHVPLAHTEGGLSVSMLRGAKAAAASGGVVTHLLADGITRDSCFVFGRVEDAVTAAQAVEAALPELTAYLHDVAPEEAAETVSRHCRLRRLKTHVVGPHLHVLWTFTTGDAAGPNMMTRNAYILNQYVCRELFARHGLEPVAVFLEANMGGDKKPSYQYFHEGHGKTLLASVELSRRTVERHLGVRPEALALLEHVGLHGAHASGMQSFAFTPASAIAAIFAATGQDLGMVATSSMAHGLVSRTEGGGILFSIRLSGLEVGTVGGGTELPHARAHLALMGCEGAGKVYRLAQIVAAAALCLEISASAAMATKMSENFFRAHKERGGRR